MYREPLDIRVNLYLNRSLRDAIDKWRAQQGAEGKKIPNLSEAIRQLCIKTLERDLEGKDDSGA